MKLALFITVILVSSVFTQTFVVAEESEYHDIIVIGAGMAGLAAASELDGDYDVIILEARDRVGGRMLTDKSHEEYYLDLGASWIHGVEKNPITALAEKYGVETKQFDNFVSINLYDSAGNLIHSYKEKNYYYDEEDEEMKPICDAGIADNEKYCEIFERFERFQEFYANESENILANDGDDVSLQIAIDKFVEDENMTEDEMKKFNFALVWWLEGEYGGDASQISMLSFEDMGYEMEGDEVIFPKGYGQIIDGLSDGLDIRLEHVVTEIDYNDNIIHIKTTKGDFDAKYVISTLPLGVLKNNSVDFSPDLPQEKINAINNLEMGLLNKVYFVFPEVFWDEKHDWIVRIPEQKGQWVYFANLYGALEEPVLLAFNAANYGHEIETKSNDEIVAEGLDVLKTIYGGDIPEPVFTSVTKWGLDEFSFGSYSYTGVGSSNNDFYELSKPLDNKVLFAGEATEVNYPATVHGAYLSGVREANRIQWLEGNVLSPKAQLDNWVFPTYVICKDGLELLITHGGESAACVTKETKMVLIERGWGYDIPYAQYD